MGNPNSYTTDDLVSNIQLISHMPLSNQTFTASQIIELADRELKTSILKQILATRGGFYLTSLDFSGNATGQFEIPSQAVAGGIANIQIVNGTSVQPVNQIEESEQYSTQYPNSTTYGYYITGNTINILPVVSINTVRIWFYDRPSALVQTTQCAQITGISSNVLTVSSLPSTMLVSTEIDCVQDQPQFNVLSEQTITAISGMNVTLDAVPSTLNVNDWITLHDQTCVPQIPVEFRPLLEQRVVVKIYELQGYMEKMQAAQMKLKELEGDVLNLINPRVKNQTKVIMQSTGGLFGNFSRRARFPAGANQ